MRHFNDILPMGAGEHTERGMNLLFYLLDRALTDLSGLQQPPCCTEDPAIYESGAHIREQERRGIEDVVRDIAVALTGKEIIFEPVERNRGTKPLITPWKYFSQSEPNDLRSVLSRLIADPEYKNDPHLKVMVEDVRNVIESTK